MSPLIIPVALEWVILVMTAAPILLAGRFSNNPRLGLTLWFAALLSGGLATLTALAVGVTSVFETYLRLSHQSLGSSGWLASLAASFAPWLILAISGVALALLNQRIEPLIRTALEVEPMFSASLRSWMPFEGYQVSIVELPVLLAAVNKGRILITSRAIEVLNQAELEAVLWHEVGHLKGRHNQLKSLSGLILKLSPFLIASQTLVSEVDRLCEVEADSFASKRVPSSLLRSTRGKFVRA